MNDNQINKTAHINIGAEKSNLTKLESMKKIQKKLNGLIHIYKHKVENYIEPLHRVTSESPLAKRNFKRLPEIIDKKTDLRNTTLDRNTMKPKFSLEQEKLKMKKTKETIQENKNKKKEEAKFVKESNRLLKENFMMLKELMIEENKQKKKIVDTKAKFIENSIANYKVLKKQFIEDVIKSEIEKETKVIEKKENELIFLKKCHEKKLRDKNLKSSNLLYPIKTERITVTDQHSLKLIF